MAVQTVFSAGAAATGWATEPALILEGETTCPRTKWALQLSLGLPERRLNRAPQSTGRPTPGVR